MMPECSRCGSTMCLIDETTKLIEYRCDACYNKLVDWKNRR